MDRTRSRQPSFVQLVQHFLQMGAEPDRWTIAVPQLRARPKSVREVTVTQTHLRGINNSRCFLV